MNAVILSFLYFSKRKLSQFDKMVKRIFHENQVGLIEWFLIEVSALLSHK